ncbi:MAG: DegT/DnrJ/EryC1/StrS family aminotransferase [Cytophagales bacterium]|nr:DegT/DnrJ/EryC1/StrS family aminotransferase [Cytophagales bacterium]
MHPIKMVDLYGQYEKIKQEVDKAIQHVINSSVFIFGSEVSAFKEELQEYLGVKHVIPCANGTDALQIAIMALDLKKGSQIIVPSFNYVAAVEVVAFLGYEPVFIEVSPDTFNISTKDIESKINKNTSAILPVHLFGQCEMDNIMDIARKHDLKVIEDAAQAIGAKYRFNDGTFKYAGTIGDVGITSFFPSKNLGCMGDGGAIFTNNDQLAEKLNLIANHGQREKYNYEIIGINSRLDNMQAAILRIKLKHLDEYIEARQTAAKYYDAAFSEVSEIKVPFRSSKSTHVFHQYTIQVPEANRDAIRQILSSKNVPSMIYYPSPIHLQTAYKYLNYKKGDLPISESTSNRVLSLPMHTELDEEQLQYITDNVIESVNSFR